MSTFTKEQLMEKLWHRISVSSGFPESEKAQMDLELARIAQASLEAKPVSINDDMAYAFHHALSDSSLGADEVEEIKAGLRAAFANVTAPPAPVALTSGYSDFEEIWSSSTHPLTQDDEMKDFAWDIWNACRAAMLQGAEPVTTANKLPFEQWLSQQTGTIDVECGCVMTEVFFHWLRVAYEAGNSPVIPDGWVACSERMPDIGTEIFYFCKDDGLRDCGIVSSSNFSGRGDAQLYVHAEGYDLRLGVDITHWMPLPAAPQQETK
ncbi:DUF551 domain-containing protein [Escherichia coli]|nr:DUF551 domain-containing protein [Escherichia coli]